MNINVLDKKKKKCLINIKLEEVFNSIDCKIHLQINFELKNYSKHLIKIKNIYKQRSFINDCDKLQIRINRLVSSIHDYEIIYASINRIVDELCKKHSLIKVLEDDEI